MKTGGVQKYLLSLSLLDSSNGITRKAISIISNGGDLEQEFNKAGIQNYYCPIIPTDNNWRPYRLFKYLRKIASLTFIFRLYRCIKNDDSDIICSNDISHILSQIFPSILLGKKFIFYIHTERPVVKQWQLVIISILLKFRYFVIISVSNIAAKNNLGYVYLNPNYNNKIQIIPSGRTLEPIIDEIGNRKINRNIFNLKDDQIIIGSIGRLHWSKGFDLLIKSIDRIINKSSKDIKLLIAGDGPLRDDYLYLIQNLNLAENVFLLGNITNVPQFLSALDIYIQPSISEGFGAAVIEAMSAGIPVASSDTGGLSEIVEDNKTGLLFQSNNLESLIDILNQMIDMPPIKKKEMIYNASRNIKKFSIENIYNNNLQVYQQLMSGMH